MRELSERLKATEEGRSAVVVVSGEAGLGKTRLVTEFAARARADGATVLVGGCADFGENGPSYWAVLEALRPEWSNFDAAEGGARIPEAPGNGPLNPTAMVAGVASSPLFEMVLHVLRRLAQDSPVVLVIEDLHWADRSTQDLLTFLLTNTLHDRVMAVVTYRSEALARRHPLQALFAELRRSRRAKFLVLKPFTYDESAAQLRSLLGRTPDHALVELIWGRSDGNPYFAEELVAAVSDGCAEELPPTLRHILTSRVDGVSDVAKQALRLVAVATDGVTFSVLKAVSGLADDDLVGPLRECVDHHLLKVHDDGLTYVFRHSLLQEVLDDELLPAEKQVFHAAFGRVLSSSAAPPDAAALAKLARHWFAAKDAERALPAALDAAAAASHMYGFAEAQRHYERAMQLWEEVPDAASRVGFDRAELCARAAEVAYLAGEPRRARDLMAGALAAGPESGPAGTAAQALLPAASVPPGPAPEDGALRRAVRYERLGHYLWAAGQSFEALTAYEEALRSLPPGVASAERACVAGAYAEALKLAGRYRASRDHAQLALRVARDAGARLEEAQILATLGFDLAFLGDAGSGVKALERAQRIAEELGQPDDIGRAYLNRAELLSGPLNSLDEAASIAAAGIDRVRRLGLERTYGVALHAVAVNILFRLGRWAEADHVLAEAFAAHPTGTAAIDLSLARAKLSVGRGRFESVVEDLRTVEAMASGGLGPRYQTPLLTIQAAMELWSAQPEKARDTVQRVISAPTSGNEDQWLLAPLIWHGLWAEADLAERPRARRDHSALERRLDIAGGLWARIENLIEASGDGAPAIRQAVAAFGSLCAGERSRAEGRPDPEVWALAAAQWDALCQPYPAAYARMRESEACYAGRTRSARAAHALRQAYQVAVSLGAEPFRREVEELAGRARVTLPAPPTGSGSVPAGSTADGGAGETPAESDDRSRGADASLPVVPPAASQTVPSDVSQRRCCEVATQYHLSARELEVWLLLPDGLTNKQISERLFISPKTASVHVTNILRKLGLNTRVQAIALAHQLGVAVPRWPERSPGTKSPTKSS